MKPSRRRRRGKADKGPAVRAARQAAKLAAIEEARRVEQAAAAELLGLSQRLASAGRPNFGLVCVTAGEAVRFRTITRTRFLQQVEQSAAAAADHLRALYADNIATLFGAIDFCRDRGIRLYRATSALFPQLDHALGQAALRQVRKQMAPFAAHAAAAGVRVLLHPDQYVVLNSESAAVRKMSLGIMRDHARALDWLGLPRSVWSPMILHGGKGGRGEALVRIIGQLPGNIRSRLVLENDENCYGAAEILDLCRRANVPMVFDAHHHLVKEKLPGYDHPSVAEFTAAAATTWPQADWQLVHISNGAARLADPKHSELITQLPAAFAAVPWVEVEAKGKEKAIALLCRQWVEQPPAQRSSTR